MGEGRRRRTERMGVPSNRAYHRMIRIPPGPRRRGRSSSPRAPSPTPRSVTRMPRRRSSRSLADQRACRPPSLTSLMKETIWSTYVPRGWEGWTIAIQVCPTARAHCHPPKDPSRFLSTTESTSCLRSFISISLARYLVKSGNKTKISRAARM